MTLLESLPQEDRNAVEVLARRAELNTSLQSSETGSIGLTQSSKTVKDVPFSYTGSLDTGLVVHHERSTTRISAETIQRIRDEIESRQSPVKMGACNKPLIPDSVGEAMNMRYKTAPQNLSYVVPLLEEQGAIATRKEGRYWMIYRR
ncbi:MAG: hypothetical protein Q8N47_26510 [Bryobacterales bacterium]|nr:hypothetical protein [Bryobacterales bacterium]